MRLPIPPFIGRLLNLRAYSGFQRAHVRRPVSIMASLYFVDRGFAIPGRIAELSLGGLRFHPALSRILDRTGDDVRVRFGTYDLDARLMNTSEIGYGLRLMRTLTQAEFDDISGLTETAPQTLLQSPPLAA